MRHRQKITGFLAIAACGKGLRKSHEEVQSGTGRRHDVRAENAIFCDSVKKHFVHNNGGKTGGLHSR